MVKIACVNMSSIDSMVENICHVSNFITEAVDNNASCIFLPECVAFRSEDKSAITSHFFTEASHPALNAFRMLAKEYNVWISVGSLSILHNLQDEKAVNRSFLINDAGDIVARYDKIHLYDVELPNGEKYSESNTIEYGAKPVLAETPWGNIGMSICYDVRFPQLYRLLASQGADFFIIPSAFTDYTGKAHWETLLRSRAIENACYVIAPNQTGTLQGKTTYGHSMIIDPWGEILADGGQEECIIYAEIDKARCTEIRSTLPCHLHDRDFIVA